MAVVNEPPDGGIGEKDEEGQTQANLTGTGLLNAHADQDIGAQGDKGPLERQVEAASGLRPPRSAGVKTSQPCHMQEYSLHRSTINGR